MALSKTRAMVAILIVYHARNDPMLYVQEAEERQSHTTEATLSVGHPAELLDDDLLRVDQIEDVGQVEEVFVHSGDISRYLNCSLEAAQNALQRLARAGLLVEHGDIDVEVEHSSPRNVRLYRPDFNDPKEAMAEIYQLDGQTPPPFIVASEEVTPSQFEHVNKSRFRFEKDSSVEIDVSDPPEEGVAIQDSIRRQLAEHGLAASSLKNFAYELRDEAGLT